VATLPLDTGRLVTVSVDSQIDKFIGMSICTGNGIGYPKPGMNEVIVASVVRIGGLGVFFRLLMFTMLAPAHLNH
jgi:hypothetical protein